jgi:REP element-mobilizing transposase RayT
MSLPERKRPAQQPVYDYDNRSNILFVTLCTKLRKRILARRDVHDLLLEAWREADHFLVGRYVIMPDHIHLFCAPARINHLPVKRWGAYWKSIATRRWLRVHEKPVWQDNLWDTQLRRGESYHAKWEYVRNNPVRHGLVEKAEEWPWQGECNPLRWHD